MIVQCLVTTSCNGAVYTENNNGPNTDLCGTPFFTGCSSVASVPIQTRWVRPGMYELNHARAAPPDIPRWLCVIYSRRAASSVSNAEDKSRRTRRTHVESSSAVPGWSLPSNMSYCVALSLMHFRCCVWVYTPIVAPCEDRCPSDVEQVVWLQLSPIF